MSLDLTYRPRLADLRPLVQSEGIDREAGPKITPAESLTDCTGYDEGFLGDFAVAWPSPNEAAREDLLHVEGSPQNRLDYTHFSIAMSQSRRIALFVGVNINGTASVKIERTNDKWFYDSRIPLEQQIGEDLYTSNLLDRGHLVRREDPNWGELAARANGETFHFTNCSPQMAGFNQKTWLSLENYLLDNSRAWKERISVFSGPVFATDDSLYRGVKIPKAFWKVVAFVNDEGLPSATAYIISQETELTQLEATFGKFKTYQCSVLSIERQTNIDFGPLSNYDGLSNEERANGQTIKRELASPNDILI